MSNQSYVRTEMLDAQPAPIGETGVLKWMRENLFSSSRNGIISLLALLAVIFALYEFLPWAIQPSWNATSLRQCLDDPNITGACWGVIRDRFNQLMYGFYPHSEQWRPLLAFLLMFVALAPVLFDKLPRKMMVFSAIYPFLGVWLLWGGSIWGPMLVVASFVVGYFVHKYVSKAAGSLAGIIAGTLATLLWMFFAVSAINGFITQMIAESRIDTAIVELIESEAAIEAHVVDMESRIEILESPLADLKAPVAALSATASEAEEKLDELKARLAGDIEESPFSILGLTLWTAVTHTELSDTEVGELTANIADAETDLYNAELVASEAARALDTQERLVSAAKGDVNDAKAVRREADRALSDMQALPELLEERTTLRATAAEAEDALEVLKDALPASVQGIAVLSQFEGELTDEARDAFNAYDDAREKLEGLKSDILNTENRIDKAYQQAGLIGLQPVDSEKFGGLMLSITIGVSGIALSLPIGIMLALGRQSDMFIIKMLSVGFIEFIRGVPLITLLFVASVLLNFFLPPGTTFDIILRVIIMVTIFASAYMAEVIRGGLAALPTGQYEAADALGLDYWQAMQLIIMPQALKISIPGIVGTFIGLFKDTTLVSIINLLDPVGLTVTIQGSADWNGVVWELYFFIALMFWIFTFSMSRYSMYLENKLKTSH